MNETTDTDAVIEELAEEHHLNMHEFGELIVQLRNAADTLERNGYMTVGVYESLDEMCELAETIGREEQHANEHERSERRH